MANLQETTDINFFKRTNGDRSHEQLMRKQLLLLAIVFLSFVWLLFQIDTSLPNLLLPSGRIIDLEFQGHAAYLVNTAGCKIMNMDPFDEIVRPYISDEEPPKCNKFSSGRLVKADDNSLYIDEEVLQKMAKNMSIDPRLVKCYYTEFWRLEHPPNDNGIYPPSVDTESKFSEQTIEIINRTRIVSEEFLKIFCEFSNDQIYLDYFAFPRVKNLRRKEENSVSVLLIGLDAVSRLNLHRQMPLTIAFLKEKIPNIEMLGYNKVGDNTFPNMVAALSGFNEVELQKTCWKKRNVFDDCPFIWKKYQKANFSTGYYEDAAWMGLFNYGKYGFRKQPTDFYSQIFSLVAEQELGCDKRFNAELCIGNRMTFNVLLENARRYILKSKEILTWAIFWSSSLTHDILNMPKFGDLPLTRFMEDLFSNGVFNSTVVIFMSDHGIRWGGIRSTYQGYVEERLPFLFICFPEWFINRYPLAVRNLRTNRQRLTTHFDLHETLVDLVDLKNLQDDIIKERTNKLYFETKRGISLFLPVTENRTCTDAGITENWCTCYTSTPLVTSHPMVKRTAKTLVNHMNQLLIDYRQCSTLTLQSILSARVEEVNTGREDEMDSINNKVTDYIVSIVTVPGNGVFEATVRYSEATKNFTVINSVSRLNIYGDQSKCISHYLLKLYCFCI